MSENIQMNKIDTENSIYAQKAKQRFLDGCNCAQAVFLAFSDLYDIDEKTALRLSSSFGGGIGRLREVCGCVSGMCMAAGLLYGYDDINDHDAKSEHYKRIQDLAEKFRNENGSIICRELLGIGEKQESHIPEKRTAEYYKKRPCAELTAIAAAILEEYITHNPIR